jgi:heme/copper-type cytochrome/quinol oxidase subunit 2
MDLVSILATVILVTTVGTIVVGVGAYFAFKVRDRRKPGAPTDDGMAGEGALGAVFLRRYEPAPPNALDSIARTPS